MLWSRSTPTSSCRFWWEVGHKRSSSGFKTVGNESIEGMSNGGAKGCRAECEAGFESPVLKSLP